MTISTYLTSIAAAAMMIAAPVSATTIAWTAGSDFDQLSQSFAPETASKISFSGTVDYSAGFGPGPIAHSHGQNVTWTILLTVNGVDQTIYSQSLQDGNYANLVGLGTISFASGSVSKLTFDCVNCSGNTYHQFGGDTAFTLSGGVPEPETWAMMIAGFGMVGFAARRRSAAIAA